jgi:hypothetical protein
MKPFELSRRAALSGAAALAALSLPGLARAGGPAIHVLKDPDCGCCGA